MGFIRPHSVNISEILQLYFPFDTRSIKDFPRCKTEISLLYGKGVIQIVIRKS